jgi:hypothetical protein
MKKGIVYLIQPAELIGTNRFKIGCSEDPSLKRIKSYLKGTTYKSINECNNPFVLEEKIKKEFNKKFKLFAGKEYFEGSEKEMIKLFLYILLTHNYEDNNIDLKNSILNSKMDNSDIKIDSESEIENDFESEDDEVDCNVKNHFKNYKDDIYYGGKKKLIKKDTDNENYDTLKLIDISCGDISENVYAYWDLQIEKYAKVLDKKVFKNNKIYDLHDYSFIEKLNKHKTIINDVIIEECRYKENNLLNCFDDNKIFNNTLYEIDFKRDIIMKDCIINGKFCGKLQSHNQVRLDEKTVITIYELGGKLYDRAYLQEHLPYMIYYTDKYYYMLDNIDREGTYEDHNFIGKRRCSCCLPTCEICNFIDNDSKNSIYLFRCWYIIGDEKGNKEKNEKEFNEIKQKFINITKGKICLNLDIPKTNLLLGI